MQTSLMFVDLKPLGMTPNSQKLAIKMPQDAGGEDYSGFSDIVNALMAIAPEDLQNSLGQMDWIEVQGDGTGYAPLLDLSAARENGTNMARMLMGELAQNNSQQSTPQVLNPVEKLDAETVRFIRSNLDQAADQLMPQKSINFSNAEIAQSQVSPTKEDISSSLLPHSTKEGLSQSEIESAGQDLSDNEKTIQNHPIFRRNSLGGQHAKLSHAQAPISEDGSFKILNAQDLHPSREAAAGPDVNASVDKSGTKQVDLPPATILAEEMTGKSVKNSETGIARVVASQNDARVNLSAGQTADQQFENNNHQNDSDAQLLMKQAPKAGQASDGLQQHFRLSEWEGTTAISDGAQDALTNVKQDAREVFQQMVSQTKSAAAKPVEHLASHNEAAPQTNDMQTNVIRQIVQRMNLHSQGSQSTMTLKLKPEFLGNVHMQISTDHQQVVVRMATESAAVKEMVEQGLQYLKTEMQHHGLEIDKFEVFVANDNESSNPGQDLAGFRQALKQRQQNAMKNGANKDGDDKKEVSETDKKEGRVTEDDANEIDYFV